MTIHQALEQKGIALGNRQAGEIKTICPACSHHRKNKSEKCLSVNIDLGVFNCHHCDFKGSVNSKPQKIYTKPLARLENLSKKALSFFEGRGISNDTTLRMKVTESSEWMPQHEREVVCICFNYFKNGELVNIKFRGPDKAFKLSKDSELVLYNLDSINGEKTAVIVEGEMDVLTLVECGIYNCLSVPNGASKGIQRLEYLDNCWQNLEDLETVVLMVDNDEAGRQLKEELARRIGAEKCKYVSYPEGCKDANDILIKYGKQVVIDCVDQAVDYPIDGIVPLDDIFDEIVDYYENGYPTGLKLGAGELDNYLNLSEGQLTIVTGIPGSGKSEFVDWLISLSVKNLKWPWLICSFETKPSLHVTKLQEKIVGKSFMFRKNPQDRIQPQEFRDSIGLIDQYFYFMNSDKFEITLDYLLEKAKEMVKCKGIKGILIDPWNWIEHSLPKGQSETSYISDALTKIQKFVKAYNVHCFLIAHPTKMPKDLGTGKYQVPTLYNISGSAHFFNKTDNGFVVVRDFVTNDVEIGIQKIKNSWNGKLGNCTFRYDVDQRQYK